MEAPIEKAESTEVLIEVKHIESAAPEKEERKELAATDLSTMHHTAAEKTERIADKQKSLIIARLQQLLMEYPKDVFIFSFLVAIIGFSAIRLFTSGEGLLIDTATGLLSKIVILILSFVAVFEIAHLMGIHILVPKSYINFKRQISRRNIQDYMEEYFKNEIDFFKKYDQERIEYIFSSLGISKSVFEKEILMELVRIKSFKNDDYENICNNIKEVLKKKGVLISAKELPSTARLLSPVENYINLFDIMYDKDVCSYMANAIIFLIHKHIEPHDLSEAKIIVSHSSNYALAQEVSRKLNKHIIRCFNIERISENRYWEGNLLPGDKVIFVHDVLASGAQLKESINNLPGSCDVLGIVALVNRTDFNGKNALEKYGVRVYSAIDINDDELSKMTEGQADLK